MGFIFHLKKLVPSYFLGVEEEKRYSAGSMYLKYSAQIYQISFKQNSYLL